MRAVVLLKGAFLLAPLGLAFGSAAAPAPSPGPFLTLGGFDPNSRALGELDPSFPTGARLGPPRPELGARACSRTRPVCAQGASESVRWAAVEELVLAYDALVLALGVPAPLPDAGGGSPALDLYLVGGWAPLEVSAELAPGRGDARAAYCIVGEQAFDSVAAHACVARGAAHGLDAAETPAVGRALATHLTWLALGPDTDSIEAVDTAQSNTHLAPLTRDATELSSAGALFLAHVEAAYGSGRPGEAALSLYAQSRADDASTGLRWNNEPDLLDVLRHATGNEPSRFADLALDFAIARAFLGDRSDGLHHPDAAWLGTFGRVRFDWNVSFSSLPRNLAALRPLEPLGSAYVWLDLAAAPPDTELGTSFSWEAPVRFRFSIVAVDAAGRELQRFDVPFFSSGTQVERTVRVPPGAAGLVFVALNLGGVSADYPFDPDHEPWEPHGFELYVARL